MANLPNLTPRILENTLKLVKFYNTNPKFKELFDRLVPNPRVTYQGQPLKLYLRVITATSFKYRKYEKEVRSDPEKFKELLILFYKDPKEFGKFEKMVQGAILGKNTPKFLTEEEIKLVEQIEKTPEGKEKENYINQLEQKLKTSQPKEEAPSPKESRPLDEKAPREVKLPHLQLPKLTISKGLASGGQILARKLIYRFGANIFSGGVGGVVAAGLGRGPVGILAGIGMGGVFPTLLKNSGLFRGGLAMGGKAALGLGLRGAALAVPGPGWVLAAAMSAPDAIAAGKKILATSKRAAIIGGSVAGVIFVFIFMDINKTGSAFPPFTSIGEAAPLPPGYIGGEIASCKFTRSGDSIKELTYQSPLLLSYIQEASNLTNIPPVVLAAFIRVETPSTVTKNDNEIKNLSTEAACPKSETGALGVMQLQPEGTKGNDADAITNGAKLIGKEYSQLTKADYCDVRKNIIMGAGFILKKMTYKTKAYPKTYGDGTKWDTAWTNEKEAIDKLVSSYYGCLRYGSPDDVNISCNDTRRKYSYGNDVWNSIQSCKVTAPQQTPTDIASLEKGLLTNFKVQFKSQSFYEQGIDQDRYQKILTWAWEILSYINSNTPKFSTLLQVNVNNQNKIIQIYARNKYSERWGDVIYLSSREGSTLKSTPEFFKQNFIHELAHVINNGRPGTYGSRFISEGVVKEGYLTKYSASATPLESVCAKDPDNEDPSGITRADEDFAESISYFINKDITKELDYGCGTNSNQNPIYMQAGGRLLYPAHYDFISKLLK